MSGVSLDGARMSPDSEQTVLLRKAASPVDICAGRTRSSAAAELQQSLGKWTIDGAKHSLAPRARNA